MSQDQFPPFRIKNPAGTVDVAPVFNMTVSGATLTRTGPTDVQLLIDSGAAGSTVVYSPTGAQYVTLVLDPVLTAERILVGSTGLTLTDQGANSNVPLAVNTNVRDKVLGFFVAGTLTTVSLASSARIFIPFNMELRDVRLSVVTTPVGANIITNLYQFGTPVSAGSAFFTSVLRPIIATGGSVGSAGILSNTVMFQGSWLGFSIDQIGTTSTGESMTMTVIVRTS